MSMTNKKSIRDIDVAGKKVIVRVDFNVPLDENRNITDDKRIVGALPTIKYLVENKAKTILVSHLGRPKDGFEDKFSMKPVAERLGKHLNQEVIMASDVVGEDANAKAKDLQDGQVLMLENVRFHKEETKNDPKFAKELSELAEIFVNDAFGTAHSAHASTAGLADYFSFHSLRHTFASHLVQKGVSLYIVSKLLGHSDVKTTEKYAHLSPETFLDVVNLLGYNGKKNEEQASILKLPTSG